MEQPPLEEDALGQGGLVGPVHRLLGHHHRRPGQRGDLAGDRERLLDQPVRGHHPSDEAGALRLLGVHHAAGQAEVHGLGLADEAGQALGPAGAGYGADGDLRLAELGAVGGDDHVAHHGDLAAAAQGVAGDRGDRRLAGLGQALPALGDEVALVDVHVGLVLHLLDVGAGGEGLLGAGHDDGADLIVGLQVVEGRGQLVDQGGAERVQRLRPVERDQADRIAFLDQDVLVGHAVLQTRTKGRCRPRAAPRPGGPRPGRRGGSGYSGCRAQRRVTKPPAVSTSRSRTSPSRRKRPGPAASQPSCGRARR